MKPQRLFNKYVDQAHSYFYLMLIVLLILIQSVSGQADKNVNLPFSPIDREFRAAWIASVANINWPSKPGLSIEEQKKEAIQLLDLLEKCNYNAAIFQVRPQADALYKSELEPWSYYLTGEQGVAPSDYYDPLKFWIEEAHKRCIELHAWINPYRAHHKAGGKISENSIVIRKPELVLELDDGYWWFDPSLEETQDHLYVIVMDIARRYDVDGIHFDDYFYPYPSYHKNMDFPDTLSWNSYLSTGGKLSRNDWRRNNVNTFIERIYKNLKLMKPHVKFGLSPFGIWRPNYPSSIKGFDQYNKLYADAKLWLNKGWIDYFSPQLYWTINDIDQSFPVLLNWWKKENYKDRHLWVGSNISRGSDEVINQIMTIRGMLSESPGNVHWSIAPLVNDSLLAIDLKNGPYAKPALIPKFPWLWNKAPAPISPEIKITNEAVTISADIKSTFKIKRWIVYYKYGDDWNYNILSNLNDTFVLTTNLFNEKSGKNKNLNEIGASVLDRFGNESQIVFLKINDN